MRLPVALNMMADTCCGFLRCATGVIALYGVRIAGILLPSQRIGTDCRIRGVVDRSGGLLAVARGDERLNPVLFRNL